MDTLFTTENKTKLLSSNSCYVLGTLATNESYYPTSGEEQSSVTAMKGSSSIIFYIKSLSIEPVPIIELLSTMVQSELYIGVDTHQQYNQALFPWAYRMTNDSEQKKQMIREKFEGKLVIFKPKINFFAKESREFVYKNLEVISVESDVDVQQDAIFVPIPQVNMNNADFEKKLLNKSTILLEDYSHAMTDPEYILCGSYLYYNFPNWQNHITNNKIWICDKGIDKIYRIKINTEDRELKNKLIRGTDNIIFMERDFLNKNIDNCQGEDIESETLTINISKNLQIKNLEQEANFNFDFSEFRFLKALKQCTIREKLCYDINDLVNFHICVKTNPITILAGMSGTGKTQLALTYAKMLDLTEEDGTLLFLPISPSYTEPSDLLGYLNSSNGLFIPSETGLTDFLVHAKDNPDKMHMVIFDEMNLSQVEHWFAPFISLLEKKEEKRTLQLYSRRANCINYERYNNSIPIGRNLVFIGTVNMDETTKDFSDRLLDRANIVVLNKKSFIQLKEEQETEKNIENIFEKYICSSFNQYDSWVKSNDALSAYNSEEINFLDELHSLIQKFDTQKGVSFRIAKKIGEYLNNIPIDDKNERMMSREDAFDIEIKQRLITKIKGTEKQFEKLIGTIRDNGDIPTNSALYNFFDSEKGQKISHFILTKREISRKAKELGIYGYAS